MPFLLFLLLFFFFFSFFSFFSFSFFFFWFFCAVVSLVVTLPLLPALVLKSRKKWATDRKTQNESQWIVSQRILSALTIPGFTSLPEQNGYSICFYAFNCDTQPPAHRPRGRSPLGSAAGGVARYSGQGPPGRGIAEGVSLLSVGERGRAPCRRPTAYIPVSPKTPAFYGVLCSSHFFHFFGLCGSRWVNMG